MKTFSSSLLRPWGALVHGVWVVALTIVSWFGFLWIIMHTPVHARRCSSWKILIEEPSFLVPAVLVATIGTWIILFTFGSKRGRYRAGATELEVRSGWVWHRTRFIRYSDITSIEIREGPLMRLLGTSDLQILSSKAPYSLLLYGVHAGEELRRFLLERRDRLHDQAAAKD